MLRHRAPRRLGIALAALALVLAACGGDGPATDDKGSSTEPAGTVADTTAATTGAAAGGDISVGMALPGPQNDGGLSQAHYEGLLLSGERLGVTVNVQENVTDPAASVDALRNLATDNELVIGVGAQFAEAGLTVAPQFPDVTFIVMNGQVDPSIPNLHVYGLRQGLPAYVAGVLAASMTGVEVTSVGFVGGLEIPPTTQTDIGFRAGVESVDPSIKYATTITGSFTDVAKAKDATAAQIASGAEVIFTMLDSGQEGAMQAAEEAGGETLMFDTVYPRCDAYPNLVGTAILNSQEMVVAMVSDYVDGNIPAEPLFYGVENLEIQRVQLCPGFDTPENQRIVDDTTQGIVDGTITLPDGI